MKLAPLDIETGGLDYNKYSLLTLYICVLNEADEVVDELDLKLKPNDGVYNVEPSAMKVNKIDLKEHDREAITYKEGRELFSDFVRRNSSGKSSLRAAGHNIIPFDIPYIKHCLEYTEDEWRFMFHYSYMDTYPIVNFMKYCGWLPEEVGRLTDLVSYFKTKKREAHNAKEDTLMWIDVFKCLLKTMRDKKSATNNDDLLILE